MIIVRLADGIKFSVTEDISLDDFAAKFSLALQDYGTITLINKKGKERRINPFQVLYFGDE